jgi:O-antigen/teichoic acid export membrane protein
MSNGRPMTTKERTFSVNAILTVFAWAVPAITAFVAVPITVRGLGDTQYGLLALTAALTGYLALMQMGLGSAIIRYLSFYRATNEGRPMLGVIWFALRWFCGAGLVGAAFLWFAAPWLIESVLDVPPDLVPTGIMVMRITAVNFVLGLLVSVGAAIPQSFLRYDISSAMSGTWGTIAAAGPAVIVTLGYGLVAVVLFGLVTNVCALLIYAVIGYRLMKTVDLDAGPPWKAIRRKALSFAGMTAANQIGSTLAQQTNRVVVGIAAGVAATAYYQVPYELASRVNEMLSRVAQVLFPTASSMFARSNVEGVKYLYVRTSRVFFLINFSVAVGLFVFAYPLLQYWVSEEYAHKGAPALMLFALSQSIHASTMAASYVNLSAARPGINLAFSSMSSAINLIAIYPLTVTWGVTGAAMAGLIGAANVPLFLHYGHRHVLELSSWMIWRRCYQPTVLGASVTGLAAYFLLRPLCDGILLTLVLWGACVLLSLVVSGLFGAISPEDLQTARRLASAAWLRLKWQHQR